ncbi:hypothetical protein BH10PSE4_BH10PSE4_42450 [soil metagenome]
MKRSKILVAASAIACVTSLGACSTMMGGDGMGYSPRLASKASDEKAFATTFASCRDQVRAGKTDRFALLSSSASARNADPGATGLILKVPYDKAKGGSRAARMAQDNAHKMAMDTCLDANGYKVAAWDSASR